MAEVMITGGTGFIGSHLVRDCLARRDRVTIISRPGSDPWRLAGVAAKIDLVRLHPLDTAGLARLVRQVRPRHVFHLAAATRLAGGDASDLTHAMAANLAPLQALLEVLDAADPPPESLVRTGTLAELGEAPVILTEDARERPTTAYGLSALMGTHLLRMTSPGRSYAAVTARLSLTYGGDQDRSFLVADCIAKALDGVPLKIRRPGSERDLLHVDDVVAALQLIARHAGRLPDQVSVSTGRPVRMANLCRIIRSAVTGSPGPDRFLSDAPHPLAGRLSCHPSPALRALGWRPALPLDRGVAQVVAWERAARHHQDKERLA